MPFGVLNEIFSVTPFLADLHSYGYLTQYICLRLIFFLFLMVAISVKLTEVSDTPFADLLRSVPNEFSPGQGSFVFNLFSEILVPSVPIRYSACTGT